MGGRIRPPRPRLSLQTPAFNRVIWSTFAQLIKFSIGLKMENTVKIRNSFHALWFSNWFNWSYLVAILLKHHTGVSKVLSLRCLRSSPVYPRIEQIFSPIAVDKSKWPSKSRWKGPSCFRQDNKTKTKHCCPVSLLIVRSQRLQNCKTIYKIVKSIKKC